MAYDYCVGSTAIDAAKLGYETFVIKEGTKSVDAKGEMGSLKAMCKRLEDAGVKEIGVTKIGEFLK